MGKRPTLTNETIQAMQADRDAGMLINKIAEKYGVSPFIAAYRTVPAPKEPDQKWKATWPEWKEWDVLHERYGRKAK